jgi:intraflagellar transport protein 140
VEIDEYRDYDKAVGAYQEALKHLQQSNTKAGEDMKDSILKKIDTIQRFIQARNMEQEDPKKMVYLIEVKH